LNGCKTGQAKITPGFKLPARYVIHTVGPVWRGGTHGEETLLASCYSKSLVLAQEHQLHTLVFPSISTGAYGYPIELAAQVAVSVVRAFGSQEQQTFDITFCCFSDSDLDVYTAVLARSV
jgi:O-acetyl-ADP-ribose deacetylase (regulator of RNase III)